MKLPVIFSSEEPVYVVAEPVNGDGLDGKHVIAVGAAALSLKSAEVRYWSDPEFWSENADDLSGSDGIKITADNWPGQRNDVIAVERSGFEGLETRNGFVRHGGCAVHAAINVAYHMGARQIRLVGWPSVDGRHSLVFSKMAADAKDLGVTITVDAAGSIPCFELTPAEKDEVKARSRSKRDR